MTEQRSIGRLIGVFLIAQIVGGGVVNFMLFAPVITPPGFLVNAAANSLQLSVSVLIGFVTAAISVAIAIAVLPIFRNYSHALAHWLLALAIAGFALAAVEQSSVLSMLSLSKAYTQAEHADETTYQALRGVVAASRNWAHYTNLFIVGGMFLVLYSLLYRFALIPRALAIFGLVAVILQMIAVAMPFFGHRIVMWMILPMGLSHLLLALWLTARGFEQPPTRMAAGTAGAGG